jgi:hypothetical protein
VGTVPILNKSSAKPQKSTSDAILLCGLKQRSITRNIAGSAGQGPIALKPILHLLFLLMLFVQLVSGIPPPALQEPTLSSGNVPDSVADPLAGDARAVEMPPTADITVCGESGDINPIGEKFNTVADPDMDGYPDSDTPATEILSRVPSPKRPFDRTASDCCYCRLLLPCAESPACRKRTR